MTLEPLLAAPPAVQFHVATVLPAAVLGAVLLARPKGTALHRRLGKVWLLLMVLTSFSTFFIHDLKTVGDFSPIHLLSVYVIVGSVPAIRAARRRDIRAHRGHVAGMYFGGIVVAGLFTLAPDRVMGAMIFDGASGFTSVLAAAVVSALLVAAGALAARQAGWVERFEAVFRRR
ncbi:DUF2306 domain-containing protein [Shinella sp. 838]|jgi:uncharacterized membrane protein|uniref:DUF2306 domain-containing protein n=1 Tax=unclassified Shinella TaxID=2643062 RepID=UPI000437AB93|nr:MULTISPECIES: DUF2306 domain-containing protein [unclassified Shinella]EYR79064.1 putative membrane protein [Shinella sp. DD12]MCA0343016.1 DUF2306 domain-containing protein [Pseudomonadota bacterium]MDG4670190.1 DUF2306 domain-containing protein [Shinella sp. 838]